MSPTPIDAMVVTEPPRRIEVSGSASTTAHVLIFSSRTMFTGEHVALDPDVIPALLSLAKPGRTSWNMLKAKHGL